MVGNKRRKTVSIMPMTVEVRNGGQWDPGKTKALTTSPFSGQFNMSVHDGNHNGVSKTLIVCLPLH